MPHRAPRLLDPTFPLPLDQPFTRRQAVEAGISDNRLGRLVKLGLLRRPVASVYVAAQAPDTLLLRTAVLALVVPPGSFVCDRTAAWLHGAAMARAPNEHLEVPQVSCFRPRYAGRLRNGVADSGERTVPPDDLVEVGGVLATTPLRTALDLGRLARTRDLAMAGMDALLALGSFTHEELLSEVPRFARQRGVRRLRALSPLADGGAQSPGESALRLRWYDAGLPRPRTQVPVPLGDGATWWLDMGLEDLRFAAEYDGKEWHTSSEQVEHDRRRRNWLQRRGGWAVEVFDRHGV